MHKVVAGEGVGEEAAHMYMTGQAPKLGCQLLARTVPESGRDPGGTWQWEKRWAMTAHD